MNVFFDKCSYADIGEDAYEDEIERFHDFQDIKHGIQDIFSLCFDAPGRVLRCNSKKINVSNNWKTFETLLYTLTISMRELKPKLLTCVGNEISIQLFVHVYTHIFSVSQESVLVRESACKFLASTTFLLTASSKFPSISAYFQPALEFVFGQSCDHQTSTSASKAFSQLMIHGKSFPTNSIPL